MSKDIDIRLRGFPIWLRIGSFKVVVYSWIGGGVDIGLPRCNTLTIVGFLRHRQFNAWVSEDATPTRASWMLRPYSDAALEEKP